MGLSQRSMALRKTRIGASEAAALPGIDCHPYKTPADLYARLVHGIEQQSNSLMSMGNAIEGFIFSLGRDALAKGGLWARRNSRSVVRDHYVATTDGHCECGGVVECKNVSWRAAEWWADGGMPPWHRVQIQLQMKATGRDHAHVWALLAGTQFIERRVAADPGYQQQIVDAIDAFFTEHVDPRVPPSTDDAGLLLTFTRPEDTVIADGYFRELGDEVAEASRDKAAATNAYDANRRALAAVMARANVRELIGPNWSAKAAPADKDEPDGEWRLTFSRKRNS